MIAWENIDMSTWLNKMNIYIFLWLVYSFQDLFLLKGSFFSQLLIIALLIYSLYSVFVVNTQYRLQKPLFFCGLNALIFLFTVYGIFYLICGGRFEYLKNIYKSLLPIYSFYILWKERAISERTVFFWITVFFLLTTFFYYRFYQEQLLLAALQGSSREEFTNNIGYLFLSLIPLCVFLYKKPLIQYIALGYCMVFILLAMKRGAIFIGVICLVWFLWNNMKKANVKKKIALICLSLLLVVLGVFFVQKQMNESLYFQKRVENTLDGNSSGRDRIYGKLADYFWNGTSPFQFILGSGAETTVKVAGNFAHNDWLEIAVNQGLLGIFIYMFYWILFAKECLSKFYGNHEKLALQMLFVIYFMKALFSMSYGSIAFSATFVFGYCLAQEKKNEQVIYRN